MQEFWNFILRYAGVVAVVCAGGAAYYLSAAYRARRESRSAMFNAERQVTKDRMARFSIVGLLLVGLTLLFFGLALMGVGNAPLAEQPTRPPTRTSTPRAGITPSLAITPTRQPTSSLPTVPPPPAATKTPAPVVTTPGAGGKTAVVTGTADAGGLKLRKTPNGELIDSLPDGTVVELLGVTESVGGVEWQNVRDPRGREGWVAGQYLIINP
jgi:Bacterial SH3 domain